MNYTFLREAIRQNLLLLVAFVAVAGMAVFAATRPPTDTATAEAASAADGGAFVSPADVETPFKPGGVKRQEAMHAIADYKEKLAKDQRSEEAALNFRRVGNLYYSQVGDFEQAMLFYEALIAQFPDWEGLRTVYPNLAECYRKLGKADMERETYKRMREYYPEETQEYLFATQQLGL